MVWETQNCIKIPVIKTSRLCELPSKLSDIVLNGRCSQGTATIEGGTTT